MPVAARYSPNALLDQVAARLRARNDAHLCRLLDVQAPVISKVRHHKMPVSSGLLLRMHEITNLSVRDLRDLMGDRRGKLRMSAARGRSAADAHAA